MAKTALGAGGLALLGGGLYSILTGDHHEADPADTPAKTNEIQTKTTEKTSKIPNVEHKDTLNNSEIKKINRHNWGPRIKPDEEPYNGPNHHKSLTAANYDKRLDIENKYHVEIPSQFSMYDKGFFPNVGPKGFSSISDYETKMAHTYGENVKSEELFKNKNNVHPYGLTEEDRLFYTRHPWTNIDNDSVQTEWKKFTSKYPELKNIPVGQAYMSNLIFQDDQGQYHLNFARLNNYIMNHPAVDGPTGSGPESTQENYYQNLNNSQKTLISSLEKINEGSFSEIQLKNFWDQNSSLNNPFGQGKISSNDAVKIGIITKDPTTGNYIFNKDKILELMSAGAYKNLPNH